MASTFLSFYSQNIQMSRRRFFLLYPMDGRFMGPSVVAGGGRQAGRIRLDTVGFGCTDLLPLGQRNSDSRMWYSTFSERNYANWPCFVLCRSQFRRFSLCREEGRKRCLSRSSRRRGCWAPLSGDEAPLFISGSGSESMHETTPLLI